MTMMTIWNLQLEWDGLGATKGRHEGARSENIDHHIGRHIARIGCHISHSRKKRDPRMKYLRKFLFPPVHHPGWPHSVLSNNVPEVGKYLIRNINQKKTTAVP